MESRVMRPSSAKASWIMGTIILLLVVVVFRINEEFLGHPVVKSLRALTFWNLILSGLFLLFAPFFFVNPFVLVGFAVIGLNFFVLIARSFLLRFGKDKRAAVWFGDILTHYVLPILISTILFIWIFSKRNEGYKKKNLWFGGLILLGILIFWMTINVVIYAWRKTWPYGRGQGNISQDKSWVSWLKKIAIFLFSYALVILIVLLHDKRVR